VVPTDVSVVRMAAVGSAEGAVTVSSGDANGNMKAAAGVEDAFVVRDSITADQGMEMPVGSQALMR
jgi:hypothetical protein